MEVTYGLMIAIGAITYFAWQRPDLHRKLMLNTYATFHEKQLERLITSGFVHNNGMHLFMNMFTLYFFGGAVEDIFSVYFGDTGNFLYVLLFLTAVAVANLPTLFKQRDNPNYNSLGASGGVSALVMAFILFDPLQDLCLYGIVCLPGYALGGLFIAYSVVMGKRGGDNINHDAHLFGALYGIVFILALKPSTLQEFINTMF